MGHRKEEDYEVATVSQDIWTCDFCERDIEDESDIHVFGVDPQVKFSCRSSELVWTNKDEMEEAVDKYTTVSTTMDGHICSECVRGSNLSTSERVRGVVVSCLRKLRLT